jgi:hypothetical protein
MIYPQPKAIKCKVSIYTGVICKDDKNDNKREVDVEARLFKVCGQDSKGNKVCAEKREELAARGITVSAIAVPFARTFC